MSKFELLFFSTKNLKNQTKKDQPFKLVNGNELCLDLCTTNVNLKLTVP
jgi:hypothetical protein